MPPTRHSAPLGWPTSSGPEADFDPLPCDADAARAFGQVADFLRRSGRKASARAYDAMIAAIAMANGLPLYTCNPDDFAGIDSAAGSPAALAELSCRRLSLAIVRVVQRRETRS